MLKSLYIKNFALIDELEIQFSDSLNIIMGETGAGKSVIIDALMLSLGERASFDLIRKGEKKAVIEAIFYIDKNNEIITFLNDNEIDSDNELIIRRELTDKGNSRCFVNDSPVTLSLLKQIGDLLVDFHGQYDHQILLRPESHINVIDNIANFKNLKNDFAKSVQVLKSKINSLNHLIKEEANLTSKLESYKFELDEITKIDPQKDELQELEDFISIAENSETLFLFLYRI